MTTGENPGTAPVDIRTGLIEAIDGQKFPNLWNFFKTLPETIIAHPGVVDIAKHGSQGDMVAANWLGIVDAAIRRLDDRYTRVVDEKDQKEREVADLTQQLSIGTDKYSQQAIEAQQKTTQVTNLTIQVANLTHQLANAQGTIQTLQNTTTAHAPAIVAPRTNSIPHPTPFSGDEKDSAKRTQEFNTWKLGIMSRWDSYPGDFPTERAKINYINTLLKGTAAAGVHNGIVKVFMNPTDPTKWTWRTGQKLLEHLTSKYATLDMVAEAERKLRDLSQANEYARFTDFLTEFVNLTDICEWDNASRVRGMESRISGKLKRALATQLKTPEKDDFQGWVEMMQTLATKQEALEHLQKRLPSHGGNGDGGQAKNNRANDKADDKGDPMDLDAMKLTVARLTDVERNRRYNEGLCYHCARPGHLMKNCPNVAGRSGRGTRGGRGSGNQRGGFGGFSGFGNQNQDHFN